MKKVVLTFGCLSGFILAIMFVINFSLMKSIGWEAGEIIGWTSILVSMSFIFFGIRSYRENYNGGFITYGKAFKVGILIALIGSLMYVITWEITYNAFMPDFYENYTEHMVNKMKLNNAPLAEIESVQAKMKVDGEAYKNPLVRIPLTFLEIFPVALVLNLIFAGILTKKQKTAAA